MNANLRNFALWVIIVLLLLALFTLFQNPGQRTTSQDISFSQLLSDVDQGRVRDVLIQGPEIHGTWFSGCTTKACRSPPGRNRTTFPGSFRC
jgi:cell division protease FtsH